jgi:hypothetical protein
MKIIFLIFIVIVLIGCKPNKRCHNSLEIINNSDTIVNLCVLLQDGNTSNYFLDIKKQLKQGESMVDNFGKSCLEKAYSANRPYNFFMVNPSKYNSGLFLLDSIYKKSKILKEYNLTSDNIKNFNYKIFYP